MGRRRKIKSPRQNVSSEKTTKTTRNSNHTHTVSVNPSTFQSLSTRNGRVHGDGGSNPARSTGGRIGGGDHAGHGHLPICGSLKGDNTITMTLRHTIHKSSAQAAAKRDDVSHVFAARQGFINVSNICGPCFTTRCLLLLCCDGLYRRAQSRAIDMSSHLKRPLHCTTGRPADRSTSARATCFTMLNCVTLATLAHTQTRAIAIHVEAVGVDVCGLLERWDEERERERER